MPSIRGKKSHQRVTADRARAKKATAPRQVDIMLDEALDTIKPEFGEIVKRVVKEAKTSGTMARFIVEFVAKYKDREEQADFAKDLQEMTRRLTGDDSFMPQGIEEELAEQAGGDGPAPELLESEEEDRVVRSDLAAAPGLVGAAQDSSLGSGPRAP